MNLNLEFKNIREGQDRILEQLDSIKNTSRKKEEIYTLNDLAQMFKVTRRTIFNWKEHGILPVTVIGSKTYVTEKQLFEFLENNEVKSVKR